MNANPPGVDELDPARLDAAELEKQLAGEIGPTDEPPVEDLPPATPDGHHQTHRVPVDMSTAPAAGG